MGLVYLVYLPTNVPSKSTIHVPIGSMYGIFTYVHHENQLNVGKYTIHGSYGVGKQYVRPMDP